MRMISLIAAALAPLLLTGSGEARSRKQTGCPFLPQFAALSSKIESMPPNDALLALNAYSTNPRNENPAGCESEAVYRLAEERERLLVYLSGAGGQFKADQIYRCDDIGEPKKSCEGPVLDLTALPSAGRTAAKKTAPPGTGLLTLQAGIDGLEFVGAFEAAPSALQNGGTPAAVPVAGTRIDGSLIPTGHALLIIFKSPLQWKYRKFVWYF